MRTVGKDLNKGNPYLEREVRFSNYAQLKERILSIAGGKTVENLRAIFRRMDEDGNGVIDPIEFKHAMKNIGVIMTEEEIT